MRYTHDGKTEKIKKFSEEVYLSLDMILQQRKIRIIACEIGKNLNRFLVFQCVAIIVLVVPIGVGIALYVLFSRLLHCFESMDNLTLILIVAGVFVPPLVYSLLPWGKSE